MMNVLNYYTKAYTNQLSNVQFEHTLTKQAEADESYLAFYTGIFFFFKNEFKNQW